MCVGCLGGEERKTRSLKTGWSVSVILMCWNKSDIEDSHQSQEPKEVFFKGKCSMKYELDGCWLLLHSIRIKDHVHDAQIKVSQSVFMIPPFHLTNCDFVCLPHWKFTQKQKRDGSQLQCHIFKVLDRKLLAKFSGLIPKISLWMLPCLSVNNLSTKKKSVQTEQINPVSLKAVNSPVWVSPNYSRQTRKSKRVQGKSGGNDAHW